MGFFSSLAAENYDRKYTDRELLRRIGGYLKPQRGRMLLIILSVLVISAAGAAQPLIVSRGLDQIQAAFSDQVIFAITGIVLTIGVISWLANWASRRLTVRAMAAITIELATQGFAAATGHDLAFYDEVSSGGVVSRITSDTQDFGQLIMITTDVISQIIEAIILSIVLISIEWRLSLYTFAIIPLVLLIAISYRKLARKATQQGMRAMANVNSAIKETISGIAIAKNFRQETSIFTTFDQANRTSYKLNIQRGLVLSLLFPTLNALGGMASAMMVYMGGLSAVQGAVTVGAWYLFLLSLDRFLYPVLNISSFWTQIQNGLSAAERVFALIDAAPTVNQIDDHPVSTLRGKIDFNHIYFHYKDTQPILQDFNLHIQPGENIALVGHTGAGKSSIARLIARFYEFQQGKLLIDDTDIRTFNLHQYRHQLGIVSQSPFLFSGTVAENIRYANENTSDKEIYQLANQIGNGEWLETLPQGPQTFVGERGSHLSMGQRQLVSFNARPHTTSSHFCPG